MADQPVRVATEMQFEGTLSRIAREGGSAASAATAVRDEAARLGVTVGFQTYQEIMTRFSAHVAVAHGSTNLMRAAAEEARTGLPIALSGSHMAPATYAPARSPMATMREYAVRVNFTSTGVRGTAQDYVTLKYSDTNLPLTVGELVAQAQDIAGALVNTYAGEVSTFGPVEISEL